MLFLPIVFVQIRRATVAEYPTPKDAKQLKQFLGLANYYATIAEPLHKVLRGKPKHFSWNKRLVEKHSKL